jgi:hypothetical protein
MVGSIPQALYVVAIAYALVGLVFAVAFLLWGLDRFDTSALGRIAFRPLLVPGLALLWPYMLLRWQRGSRVPTAAGAQRRQRAAHARIWFALAAILPLIFLGGFFLRQGGPLEAPAVQLAPPKR